MLLERVADGKLDEKNLLVMMDPFLTRPSDGELFGLDPSLKAAAKPPPKKHPFSEPPTR